MITDKLASYGAAKDEVMRSVKEILKKADDAPMGRSKPLIFLWPGIGDTEFFSVSLSTESTKA